MTKKNVSLVRIEHIWSVLCSDVSVDQVTQNVTLFNVIEQLNLKKTELDAKRKSGEKIVIPFPFKLVIFFRKIGDSVFSGDIKCELVDPAGQILGGNENEINFPDIQKDRLRVITGFSGMPIDTEGYYLFRVFVRAKGGQYEKVSEVPLQIKFI